MNRNLLAGAMVAMAMTTMLGCAPTTSPMPGGGDMSNGGGGDLATGTGGNGGEDMAKPPVSTALPFVIDTAFVSSGFMGDGETAGQIAMVPAKMGDSIDCNGGRGSSTALGSCHSVVYTPPASGGKGWGGVYWQYPANNWGMKAGYSMPTGAKKVAFSAKGAKGGEKVTFLAGGIINAGNPYTDSIKASVTVTLTTSWAPYSIDLSGQSYTAVLGGFGWTMAAADAGTSGSFFVDDIQWQ